MELYSINEKLQELDKQALIDLKDIFKEIDENEFKNTEKVLKAFQDCSIDTSCFYEVCGYGNSDYGRDKLEELYSKLFQAEDAIVRPQIMSGTHALYVSLSGLLKYGDTMLSITGLPYDTLQSIIGITGNSNNSLIKCGILYEQIDLVNDTFDTNKIIERVKQGGIKLIEIQKSTGYSMRKSLSVKEIKNIIAEIRKIDKEVIIMVDNCYGEFVEEFEPISVGADVMISSLMKNLGAGIATSGGYVVGKKEYIEAMKKNQLLRALRVDKMTIAALEATFRSYLDEERAIRDIPVLQMLALTKDEAQEKCGRFIRVLEEENLPVRWKVEEVTDMVGGGSYPEYNMPGYAVALDIDGITAAEAEKRLREADIPVIVRVQHDRVLISVRTVQEDEFIIVCRTLASACK